MSRSCHVTTENPYPLVLSCSKICYEYGGKIHGNHLKKRQYLDRQVAWKWPVQTLFWCYRVWWHQVKPGEVAPSRSSSTPFHLSQSSIRQKRDTPGNPNAWPPRIRTRCRIQLRRCIGWSCYRREEYSRCNRLICREVPSLAKSLVRTDSHISNRRETTFCRADRPIAVMFPAKQNSHRYYV